MTTGTTGTRITFYGFGAFVGNIKGATQVEWFPDDPATLNWAAGALIATDLSKNITAARNGMPIADIQVDDHRTDGGLTTVGPRFPQGTMVGGIWLRDTIWNNLPNQPKHPCTANAEAYELTTHVYLDGQNIRRFHGFHGKIVGTQGPLTHVLIWSRGRGRVPGEKPLGPFWLDLAQVAHPVGPGGTEIGPNKQEGAVYLDGPTVIALGGGMPKLPPGYGL
jgi:hypothetical protein